MKKMRPAKITVTGIVCALILISSGCVSDQQYKDLRIQNNRQQKRLAELESLLQTATLQAEQMRRQLDTMGGKTGIEISALQQRIAALEEDIAKKKALIEAMQKQLLGGIQLPIELSTMLAEWAQGSDLVTFDPNKGIVKFKSDLLFKAGSDVVDLSAAESVKTLCNILNTDHGRDFDIIVVGHTDDQPISASRERHPTNWHLSAHRAISVLNVMTGAGIVPERVSVRGFGEFRPLVPNEPGKKGNPQNRRVEIYIVPKGT